MVTLAERRLSCRQRYLLVHQIMRTTRGTRNKPGHSPMSEGLITPRKANRTIANNISVPLTSVKSPAISSVLCEQCQNSLTIREDHLTSLQVELKLIDIQLSKFTSIPDAPKDCQDSIDVMSNSVNNCIKEIELLQSYVDQLANDTTSPRHPSPPSTEDLLVVENFLNNDEIEALYAETEALEFKKLGRREVIYFGEHGYGYSGHRHEPAPIPGFLSELITKLSPNDNEIINSVLVNKYVGPNSVLGAHCDDEPEIAPWSNIYNISIGSTRTMRLKSIYASDHFDYKLKSGTLNTMTRSMQNVWTHEIIKDDSDTEGTRYSFTFRFIDPKFSKSSTLILHDSQCKDIRFGDSAGTLGSMCPGLKQEAFTVEKLSAVDSEFIASFQTVIISLGINNLQRKTTIYKPQAIADTIQRKCEEIHNINPRVKIGISTVIPTSTKALNVEVYELNRLLWLLTLKDNLHRLELINFNFLRDSRTGLIKDLYKKTAGDPIHIGDVGVKVVGSMFKKYIRYIQRSGKLNTNRKSNIDGMTKK